MDIHNKPIRIVRYISIVIFILAIAALFIRKAELNRAIVVGEDTQIRISPFATAEAVTKLEPGEMVQVLDQHKDFYQLDKGWVSDEEVKKVYE